MKKRTLTKDAVLAAAVRVVEEKGLSSLSMQELAAALDIIPSSLYNHISGLEEAQNHIVQCAAEEALIEIQEAIIGYSGNDAYLEIAIALRKFALARPELYNAIRLCSKPPELQLKEADQELVKVMHRISERYAHIDKQTMAHFIRAFSSCIFGFISTEIADGFSGTTDIGESYLIMVKQIIAMLSRQKEGNNGKD
jgi:AcrR family transcriptional regulator